MFQNSLNILKRRILWATFGCLFCAIFMVFGTSYKLFFALCTGLCVGYALSMIEFVQYMEQLGKEIRKHGPDSAD